MYILADESVDFAIVTELRNLGYKVVAIAEEYPGISDLEVIQKANETFSLIITEDKDFGELSYRLQIKNCGILLIRLFDLPRPERISLATEFIKNHFQEFSYHFSDLSSGGLRIKKIS